MNVDAARTRVDQLKRELADNDAAIVLEMGRCVEYTNPDTPGKTFDALGREKRRIATDLRTAETELATAEAIAAGDAQAAARKRYSEVVTELRQARQDVAAHYRAAALALGEFYSSGAELEQLVRTLNAPLGNGTCYYAPEVKQVLVEAGASPNPLPALLDTGYTELTTYQSMRRHLPLVPLVAKEK